MRKKISIIIPCLNNVKTIDLTLQSIFKQTIINEIEIIVVDGGSNDGTLKLIQNYKDKVKVIHFKINGIPGPICEGIKQSTGKYIGFIDSDDYIDPKMYEVLLNNLEVYNADISSCGVTTSFKMNNFFMVNKEEIVDTNIKDPYLVCRTARYNKLFKRDILLKITEFYNVSINNTVWEDTIFGLLIYSIAKKIVNTNLCLYYYCKRKDSRSRCLSYKMDELIKVNNLCAAYNNVYTKYRNPLYFRLFINPFLSLYYMCLYARLKELFYLKRKKVYKMIRNSFAFNEVLNKCRFDDSTRCMAERKDVTFKDYQLFLQKLNKKQYLKLDLLLLWHGFKKIIYKIFKY